MYSMVSTVGGGADENTPIIEIRKLKCEVAVLRGQGGHGASLLTCSPGYNVCTLMPGWLGLKGQSSGLIVGTMS